GYPLRFLQAVERPELSFVCMDAGAIKMDYEVPLNDGDAAFLALEKPEEAMVLVLVVVPEDPRQMTANLAGPLVINTRTLQGRQVMLDTRHYPLKYPILTPQEDVIVSFPGGLIGFPDLHSFRLFEPADSYPLKFLQAVEAPEISFTCIDVAAVKMDYEFPLDETAAKALSLEKADDALVLALVVIPEDPRQMTANLAGPVVVNVRTREGRQVVLNTETYPLKYPIISEAQGSPSAQG
ncbi:MAG TPA: flagellar assembly protein FliW, partial [Holophaga sp.]|nr:flagellar assembly protein FliW [Holophaga sp.]